MKNLFNSIVFLLCTAGLMAQTTVTGVVTDATGEALIGVNILESGTTNGAISDLDGSYSITVSDGLLWSLVSRACAQSQKQSLVVAPSI